MGAPFDRFDPTAREIPVVVEVPHAGLDVAAPFLDSLAAPARALARDADLYVDTLYSDAPSLGATLLVSNVSRYVIDVNRAESDVDAEVVEGARADVRLAHGLVWRTTSEGDPALVRRLTAAELEERLEFVWRPYHRALAEIVAQKRAQFGLAVVLAAHSMPTYERTLRPMPLAPSSRDGGLAASAIARGRGERRADVVPGTRGRRSAASVYIDVVESHAVAAGWSVRHDDPYAGGFTTQHYGRPGDDVHAVQVELSRALYLDETTLRPLATFASVRRWCGSLVERLGEAAVASFGATVGAAVAP